MKLNNILMLLDQITKVRLVIEFYGIKFTSEHYPEYFLYHDDSDKLLNKEVTDMKIVVDTLVCSLNFQSNKLDIDC